MERFWSKVNKRSGVFGADGKYPTECWEWIASLNRSKRGQFKLYDHGSGKQKLVEAPRVAWYLTHGHWPSYCCHKCDNSKCANPEHLYDGSPLSNTQDMYDRGRAKHFKKYSDHFVRRMRREYAIGLSSFKIALKYNLSRRTVLGILNGKYRKEAGGPIRDRGARYWTNRYSTGRTGVKSRSANLPNT